MDLISCNLVMVEWVEFQINLDVSPYYKIVNEHKKEICRVKYHLKEIKGLP